MVPIICFNSLLVPHVSDHNQLFAQVCDDKILELSEKKQTGD